MEKNAVVSLIEKVVGTDKIEYISGEIINCGTKDCLLAGIRGAVYGIAIKLKRDEVEIFFNKVNEKNDLTCDNWKSIGDDFYPLYWGKDINMGIRLYSHTKTMKSTGTLQLNVVNKSFQGREIIYGAMPCINYEENEDKLHKRYPDILKTKKGKIDELTVSDLCNE